MGILSEIYDQTRNVQYKRDTNGKLVKEVKCSNTVTMGTVECKVETKVSDEPQTVFEVTTT